jgi:hypothetical protein
MGINSIERLETNLNIGNKYYDEKHTPIIAFNSVIVTCFARSTAFATCC